MFLKYASSGFLKGEISENGQALSSKKGLKMADRGLLLSALKTYKTDYASEQGFIQEMINFIENNPNCFERSNLSGHVNGSAWVLSPDEKKSSSDAS